ncbi:MAG: tetratricopeptide repeat protein [Pseudomonadota bacterium]
MRFSVFSAAIVLLVTGHAGAQSAASASPAGDRTLTDTGHTPPEAAAHEHFERALVWYRAGKYRQAAQELDAALDRDPAGKDLVFNLALVQEKLGDIDGAIRSLQRFERLEKDPVELERAGQTIERLEGARVELLAHADPGPPPAAPCPVPRHRGRFDAWVVGTGSLAIAALLVGSVFAIRALTLDGDTTGSLQALHDRADRARGAAIVADVAFSTTLFAGAGSAALYFGRYEEQQHALVPLPAPRVSAAWLVLRY